MMRPRRMPCRSEAQEQALAVSLLRQAGYHVWRAGQRDARGTQDPGVPDCICIHPTRGVLFYECKRERGARQSPAQQRFQAICDAAGVPYVCGPVSALRAYLGITAAGEAP